MCPDTVIGEIINAKDKWSVWGREGHLEKRIVQGHAKTASCSCTNPHPPDLCCNHCQSELLVTLLQLESSDANQGLRRNGGAERGREVDGVEGRGEIGGEGSECGVTDNI